MNTPNTAASTVMIFSRDGYGSGKSTTVDFADVNRAQEWATKYVEAFPSHAVYVVEGKATLVEPPKAEARP